MSKSITTKDFFVLTDLSPEELATAQAEFAKIQPCLERKVKATYDNLMIAGTLSRLRDQHGRNSKIYNNFVSALGEFDEEWSDKHFRLKWVEAYRGYEAIPGCDADKEFIWKLKPSREALRQIRFLPTTGNRQYNIIKELKGVSVFPSAQAIERYGKTGSFTPRASLPSQNRTPVPTEQNEVANWRLHSEPAAEQTQPEPPTIDIPYVVPEEMLSANVEPEVPMKLLIGDFISDPNPVPPTTDPVIEELKAVYKEYERIVLSKSRHIQATPEALEVIKWFTSLNRSYKLVAEE